MTLVHHGGMTVDELEWFVVLAETEHMTQAATQLNISQPTLSRGLARLERQVGAPLFDRVNRRLRLNVYGRVLLEHTRRSLGELDAAGERIRSLRDPEHGSVRLAFLHSVATWLAPELIRGFRIEAPGVQFSLTQAASYELLAHVRKGQADIAITGPRPDVEDLGWHPLHREQLCLVVPRDHPAASLDQVDLAAAANEPFIVLGREFGLRQLTEDLFAHAGIAPDIAFESAEIATMEGLVAAGLGVAVVPTPRLDRAEPNAVYIPLTDAAAHRELGLVWHEEVARSPLTERFMGFVFSDRWRRAPAS
jgi:DNA-binding transcriptional LysR family regulator